MKKIKKRKNADTSRDDQLDYFDREMKRKITLSKDYTCSVISAGITTCALHNEKLDLATVLSELTNTCSRVVDGRTVDIELTLMMQAKTLDVLFNRMLIKAVNSELMVHFEKFTEIALKAQNQSRQALSALSELKHPRRTTFIKQQNNAHNQQVNNNCVEKSSKKSEDPANELLRGKNNEALDIGRTPETIALNQPMATMVEVNRRKNARGKSG